MAITLDGTAGVTTPALLNSNANGVGNIGTDSTRFNTVFAKATSAEYADVAEKYVADAVYGPGTVLELGGTQEVTATSTFASSKICGIVSTNPALIMNAGEAHASSVLVALIGRVPCKVIGKIQRGDLICSSCVPGVATAMPAQDYQPGAIIGKSLADYDSDQVGTIEVLVGRL